MSQLDIPLLKLANAVLDLPKTNDPIGKPVDEAKQEIKDMMLQLIGGDDDWIIDHVVEGPVRAELRQRIEKL